MIDPRQIENLSKNRRDFIDIFEMVYNWVTQFVSFQSDDEPIVITNWIVHTYLIHLFDFTPYLHIYSAQKQCGKSLLLGLIKSLSHKGDKLINFTEAIFRYIDKESPSLFIDEIDRWNKEDSQTIWGIINAGFMRDGGDVMRMVGNNQDPTKFKVFSPKVLSGIGKHSSEDTVQDRSIGIELERKLPTESVKRYRHRKEIQIIEEITNSLSELTNYTAREWNNDLSLFDDVHEDALLEILEQLIPNDRAIDIVEPLVVVASMGTTDWLNKTINACVKLTNREDEEDNNTDLLILRVCNNIRMLNVGSKHIFSSDLVEAIHNFKDSELAHFNNGYGIDQSHLAKRLKLFGIKTKQVRIGTESKRGYEWESFKEPVKRYLTPHEEEETLEEPVEVIEIAELF